jgi:metal-responsive CopG/Arc/MetJ family transcriptional regulator
MQKIQILFPDPMMKRLRDIAKQEDMPVSEIIRKSTSMWLERYAEKPKQKKSVPLVDAGLCLLDADEMKEALHDL